MGLANRASGERRFCENESTLRAAAARAFDRLGWNWRSEPDGGFAAVWTSPVFRFRDDVKIRLAPAGRETAVCVNSASRVGRFDFGQNARHVRSFFRELERQIAGSR